MSYSSSSSSSPSIPRKVGIDFISAGTAAAGLAPFVCTVDKCIISNASGRQKLAPCLVENLKMVFTKPLQFAKLIEVRYIYGVGKKIFSY